jgi:hypothetical protein
VSITLSPPEVFARCPCGSLSIAERPPRENVDLLLLGMWCLSCGRSPRILAEGGDEPERGT